MDKRRNKKGKWEYLIRWKGYGSKEDTWEPENHLLHCEEFIDQFNSLRLHAQKRPKVPKSRQESLITSQPSAVESSRARSEARKKKRTFSPAVGVRVGAVPGIRSGAPGTSQKQGKVGVGPGKPSARMSKAMMYKPPSLGGAHLVPAVTVPYNGLQNGETEPLAYTTTTTTAASSQRLPLHRVDGVVGDVEASGQQFTKELGKALENKVPGKLKLSSSELFG